VAVAAGVGAAAIVDLRTRRIPNAVTVLLAAGGVTLAATGASGLSIGASATGFVIGLVLMLPGHLLGATGAGDVKLLAAVGAVVGPATVVMAFLYTALVGGLLAVAVAFRRGRLGVTLASAGRLVRGPGAAQRHVASLDAGSRFPYGPAIALGSLIAVLS
jgi:prepilin peptidase CpaA